MIIIGITSLICLVLKQERFWLCILVYFRKYKTSGCKGIVVECVEKVTDSRILDFTGIYVVQIKFCFDEFIKLSDYEKKKNILELFKKGIDIIIEEKQFDKSVFDEAYIIRL